MVFVKAYAITLIVFLGLDFLWLGFVARGFYASQLGDLMRENINYLAAGIFYLAYVLRLWRREVGARLSSMALFSGFSPMAPMT